MAKYKPYSYAQAQLNPIQPGAFEFTVNHLFNHELDPAQTGFQDSGNITESPQKKEPVRQPCVS